MTGFFMLQLVLSMKILVISDLHLGRFSKKKFNFLKNLFEQYDKIIINGDLYEGYLYSLSSFVVSKWSGLFPLLLKKEAVYVFGNHDCEDWLTPHERTLLSLFSTVQTQKYTLELGHVTYIFEHGHHINPFLDTQLNIKPPRFFAKFLLWLDHALAGVMGKRFYLGLAKFFNFNMKQLLLLREEFWRPDTYFVFGHTHYGEVDLPNKFLNCGVNKYSFAQFLELTPTEAILCTAPRYHLAKVREKRYVVPTAIEAFGYSATYRQPEEPQTQDR